MYKVDPAATTKFPESPQQHYVASPNDLLIIDIYTGNGEKLIDPDRQLSENLSAEREVETQYQVQNDGTINLPMIEPVKVEGLNIFEISELLKEKYTEFYKDPYVLARFVNKRVIVLGAMGGNGEVSGQVIPLVDDQTRVSEVIALAGGIPRNAKSNNIRLLRNDKVQLIDLSTFEAYKENNIVVLPGDIVYIEPVRRPVSEFFRENNAIFGLTTGIISLISLIISLNR